MKQTKLMLGDNIESLRKLPENSIDSIVTDPPYGLSFMGKKWDYDVPSVDFWREVYRVLKPGGHVLSFGGTRTYHRMVVNIEDAGFEIRDQVMWLYGSGFPKSLNILKSINKSYICEYKKIARTAVKSLKLAQVKLNEDTESSVPVYVAILQEESQENKMEIGVVVGSNQTDIFIFATREDIEESTTSSLKNILVEDLNQEKKFITLTELKTIIDLKIWNLLPNLNTQNFIHIREDVMNMGTSIKPANEPICVARKPLSEKTIADNVLKWGTGGINIDGCRIEGAYGSGQNEVIEGKESGVMYHNYDGDTKPATGHKNKIMVSNPEGRFPANIILDETAAELLDSQSGVSKTNHKGNRTDKGVVAGVNGFGRGTEVARQDSGGASRFFYVAKVSKKERNLGLEPVEVFSGRPRREDGSVIYKETHPEEWKEAMAKLPKKDKTALAGSEEKLQTQSTSTKNTHPTLKPINLMTYLCRLITPEGGIVLDPFMGSGSTGISALLEGFRFVGMEMDGDYFKIAEARIEAYEEYRSLLK